jgi:peptide/nickel transport system substrate-binding protein
MRRVLVGLLALGLLAALVPSVDAQKRGGTLTIARPTDPVSLDPNLETTAPGAWVYFNMLEGLLTLDDKMQVKPALATSYEVMSPTKVRFKLRPGVKFHDGAAFTADDVVFSIHRAMAPTSNYKAYTTGIKEARKIDDLTVEIETSAPNPVLLRQLTNVFIMNKAWSEKNNVAKPQDYVNKEETYAARNTNGTGPYKLKSREVDVRTVFEENKDWWNKGGKVGNVTEVVFTPIKQNATRTAALLSGEIDFVLDPAAQDLERLRQSAKVVEGNEYRTIYLGLDQKRPELQYSNIKGKNPFQDIRVREALYRAIDVDAIKRAVMRGLSAPTGTMIAPQVHGWAQQLQARVPYDPEKSRALLKEAGYDGTLNFTLDCPNNRYINDEAICQAVVGMWAKVGVKATMNAMPRSTYFPKVQSFDTSAYLFGWGVPTFDAMYTLQNLIRTKGEGADGMYNLGNYSNKELDVIIDRIKTETDPAKRDADIITVLQGHAKDFGHIPLHDQVIPWAMRKNVTVVHRADNRLVADWVKVD